MSIRHTFIVGLCSALLLSSGCTKEKESKPGAGGGAGAAAPPITNRIDIPPAVRTNLGITFAKVESRRVAVTRVYPGRFELPPQASRPYHAMLPGRIEMVAKQYQPVKAGDVLYRIDSPQWRELQEKLAGDVVAIQTIVERIEANEQRAKAIAEHDKGVNQLITIWQKRLDEVAKLIEAGGGGATELAEARSKLAESLTESAKVREEMAELNEARVQLNAELERYRQTMPLLFAQATGKAGAADDPAVFDVTMARVATLTGHTVEQLMSPTPGATGEALARWRTIDRIEVKATQPGIVEAIQLSSGAWAETGAAVVTVIDPSLVRFRAMVPQGDLAILTDAPSGQVLAPSRAGAASAASSGSAAAAIALGLEADPDQRTIEVLATLSTAPPPWARPGVSSQLEIVTDATAAPALAIPVSAVIQDGLDLVYFRRDPRNPDKVIRMVGDMGISDGRWIVVSSGVGEGDEVVLDGVYELKLASSSVGQAKGGHFHADGTWHADGTPEPGESK